MSANRLPASAYERAEHLLRHRSRLVLHDPVRPHWIRDGAAFWYRVETERGAEFVTVEPLTATRAPAFDHSRLADALSRASGVEVKPYDLPFRTIEISDDAVSFTAFGARWICDSAGRTCRRDDGRRRVEPGEVGSPDGRWTVFHRGEDLWLRAADGDAEHALTTDGTAEHGYARHPDTAPSTFLSRRVRDRLGMPPPAPALAWSPDSTRVLTHRTNERGVAPLPLVEYAPYEGGRPRLHTYRCAMPGETRPCGEWMIINVHSRTVVPVRAEPFLLSFWSPLTSGRAWWSQDGGTAYYLDQPRDMRTLRLNAIDARTGQVRTLIEEAGRTRVEAAQGIRQRPMVRVLAGGREALWYSQRDGWGHLYLYDLDAGRLKHQVTKGDFAVQEILHIDETERVAHLVVSGLAADPYHRSPVRVGLDGGGLVELNDDGLDHVVRAPAHGRWFLDSASTVDTPPVTTVRDRDGSVLLEVERADVSRLLDAGWSPPERVRTVAADGVTPIYGVLYKPYGFDPARRYPVIDNPYPGPHTGRVEPSFDPGFDGYQAEALAALGFVVIAVDGRGTPRRDKAFHDHSYRNFGSAGGLEDHVTALRELAETRPWMDLDRVGVFGVSAGGFAAARALLRFPEVYRVGVVEAGQHDLRYAPAEFAETYDGPFDADAGARLSNTELAGELTGRLLLVHGGMDDTVMPHHTMRLVERLIAADKDFDLLVVPGADHLFIGYEHYVIRRRWDYLVRHLMNREPPEYHLAEFPVPVELLEFNIFD